MILQKKIEEFQSLIIIIEKLLLFKIFDFYEDWIHNASAISSSL